MTANLKYPSEPAAAPLNPNGPGSAETRRAVTGLRALPVFLVLLFSLLSSKLHGQELFFTYLGPIISAGYTSANYSDWKDTQRETLSETGLAFSGGAVIDVIARDVMGEFSLQFMNNTGGDTAVAHLLFSGAAKYIHHINPDTFLAGGLGIYYESPPATRDFDGGGGLAAIAGLGYLFSHDWYLIADITARYGSLGMGDHDSRDFLFLKVPESTKLFLGISLAVIYKVGRL